MSILQEIKSAQLQARKNKDKFKAGVLTTLMSEVSIVGKNDGSRETTDKEALAVITKFKKGVTETLKDLKNKVTYPEKITELNNELEIYDSFLPQQMSQEELKTVISGYINEGISNIGQIMGKLKSQYSGTYDGKIASEIIKQMI